MSEVVSALPDPYVVRRGDTLSAIARRSGRSVGDLQRWNGIRDVNKLAVGQTLYLSERTAFGVSALFLDALRHPVSNLPFMLKFDGQTVTGRTGATGMTPRQTTADARSQVEVWVQDAQGLWQQIARTTSDYGHKLLTLVSGAVVVPGKTEALPAHASARPQPAGGAPIPRPSSTAPQTSGTSQPPLPAPAQGQPTKNNPAVKTRRTKGPQGQAVVKVEVDIPRDLLEFFALYAGDGISDEEWNTAARFVDCEPAVLKAISEVESGGRSSFWRLDAADGARIPAILFERHRFSKLTVRRYDASHPDISWPTPYRLKKLLGHADTKMPGHKVTENDIYGDHSSAYLRLINAFRLDPEAALKACSWGKFQIMGENFALCGERDVEAFVKKMCLSEAGQLKLLCEFIRNHPAPWLDSKNPKRGKAMSLHEAVKVKDWATIALRYNGKAYKTYAYDTKLKSAYERYAAKA